MAFDHRHYVPILLTRRGERRAVADLSATAKGHMTPLFVVSPIDWNFDADEPSKSIDDHLLKLGKELVDCWGPENAFIDLLFINEDDRMANGEHPLVWLTSQMNSNGGKFIPTVSTSRNISYQDAVAAVVSRDHRGACIRLEIGEWPSTVGTAPLTSLLTKLGLSASEVDLILDLGEQIVEGPDLSLTAARNELSTLPMLHDWRSITVAGAGFPKSLSHLTRGLNTVERVEWTMYQTLLSGPTLQRKPTFGDYAIAHPDPIVDVNPRFMSISASIRYTLSGEWLVSKGRLFRGGGGTGLGGAAAIPPISAIVSDSRFAGISHCAGDVWLDAVASGANGGGNPEGWRRVGTTHHLTHMTGVVASLP